MVYNRRRGAGAAHRPRDHRGGDLPRQQAEAAPLRGRRPAPRRVCVPTSSATVVGASRGASAARRWWPLRV